PLREQIKTNTRQVGWNKSRERIDKNFAFICSSESDPAKQGVLGSSPYFTTCYDLSSSRSRRDAIVSVAKYLQRSWARCNGYLGILVPEWKASDQWTLPEMRLSACVGVGSREGSRPARLA